MRSGSFYCFLIVLMSAGILIQGWPCFATERSSTNEQKEREAPWTITAKGSLSYQEDKGLDC